MYGAVAKYLWRVPPFAPTRGHREMTNWGARCAPQEFCNSLFLYLITMAVQQAALNRGRQNVGT